MPIAVPLAARTRHLPGDEPAPQPEHDVAAAARQAASDALDRGETHYTDRPGIPELRMVLAQRAEQAVGMGFTASETVVTCGVTESRFVAIQQLASPTTTVVALGHPERLRGACMIRGVTLQEATTPWPADALLYVPEDASGSAANDALDRARDAGCAIIMEIDVATLDAPFQPADHGLADHTVVIGDAAGPFGALAWRVGFLMAPSVQVGPLRDFKQALTICTTAVSQWGTLALLEASA